LDGGQSLPPSQVALLPFGKPVLDGA